MPAPKGQGFSFRWRRSKQQPIASDREIVFWQQDPENTLGSLVLGFDNKQFVFNSQIATTPSTGTSSAPGDSSYITTASEAGLSNEKVATSTGTIAITAGASTATFNVVMNSSNSQLLYNNSGVFGGTKLDYSQVTSTSLDLKVENQVVVNVEGISLNITGSNGLGTGFGGDLNFTSGSGGASGGNGGFLNFYAGNSSSADAGGGITFTGGSGGTTGVGGNVTLIGGAGGATSGAGGSFILGGGSATAGNSNGGDCIIGGGNKSGSGTVGHVKINDAATALKAIFDTSLLAADRTYTFPNASGTLALTSGLPLGANPTASVGLTAVNGSAATFLRSDGAPALSQAIAPTWTDAHTWTPSAANTTPITVSGYSITSGTNPLLNLSGTWNTATSPTALKLNMTDTASGSSTLLADFQVSSSSRLSLSKQGEVVITTPRDTATSRNGLLINVGDITSSTYSSGNYRCIFARMSMNPTATTPPTAIVLGFDLSLRGTLNKVQLVSATWDPSASITINTTSGLYNAQFRPISGTANLPTTFYAYNVIINDQAGSTPVNGTEVIGYLYDDSSDGQGWQGGGGTVQHTYGFLSKPSSWNAFGSVTNHHAGSFAGSVQITDSDNAALSGGAPNNDNYLFWGAAYNTTLASRQAGIRWNSTKLDFEVGTSVQASLSTNLWDVVGDVRGRQLIADGDNAGVSSTNSLTNVSDTTTNSSGVGTIKMKGTTSRDSTGFIKIYVGTTAYYVPFFSAITG